MWSKGMNQLTQGHTLVSSRSWTGAQISKLLLGISASLSCFISKQAFSLAVFLLPCHRNASIFGSGVHCARGKPDSLLEKGGGKLYLHH